MKITLTTQEAVFHLRELAPDNWTLNGAQALIGHLERQEEASGEEMELDVIGLGVQFQEYPTALDYVTDRKLADCATEAEAMAFLEDITTVLKFEGGIIVERF